MTTCEVCRTPLRDQELKHGHLCATCMEVARPKKYCTCTHEQLQHFTTHCNHSYWDAILQGRTRCDCEGFKEAS